MGIVTLVQMQWYIPRGSYQHLRFCSSQWMSEQYKFRAATVIKMHTIRRWIDERFPKSLKHRMSDLDIFLKFITAGRCAKRQCYPEATWSEAHLNLWANNCLTETEIVTVCIFNFCR